MTTRFLIIVFAANALIGCSHHKPINDSESNSLIQPIEFAKGFSISSNDSSILINVKNPWQGARDISYNYLLIDSTQKISNFQSSNAEIFVIPLKKVVCLSTTHIAFIDKLGKTSTIVGVSGTQFTNSKKLRKRIESGLVKDVGYDQNLNYELIISLKPDAVLCYGIGAESVGYLLKLKELGIKIIYIGDYLEDDPLGKAEWIKVFGTFLNITSKADSLFNKIAEEYNKAKTIARVIDEKPNVFLNLPWKDSWFFPGKSNYFIKLIEDAGGKYIFSNLEGTKSYPISFEKAIEAGYNSDIWINPGSVTKMDDIKNIDNRLIGIKPCISGMVYNNNNILSPGGGNDFWESGVVHPDLILKDLIYIFHPDLLPNHKFYYYRKIE